MKANELMIGDWLKHYNGTPMQVTKITTEHFACAENGGVNCWEYNNKFEPIPITPEILEKNGFETHPSNIRMFFEHDNYRLCYYINSNNHFTIYNNIDGSLVQKVIVNVHELQHALKLCGIDKKIILK